MDRCAVFVDAGYLHESAKTLMLGGHPGATVRANAGSLVREITKLAVAQTALPLLRIYWYAAAPNRNPYPDQRELASLGDIKLRLGNLRERAGGRMVQKGVDAELHADMTGLARNRGAVDFVLLSGDEDLLRAVDEVQSYGVRVHLWGVEAGPDGGNQSLELIAAADRRYVLEEAWIRGVYTILEPPKPDSPRQRAPGGGLAEDAEPAKAAEQAGKVTPLRPASRGGTQPDLTPVPAAASAESSRTPAASLAPSASSGRIPTPLSLPKPSAAPHRPAAAQASGQDTLLYSSSAAHSGYSVPDYDFHRLSDLTTQAEQFADAAEDARTTFDAITVGRVYARRWLSRATPEAAAMLTLKYPTIPRSINAELLRYSVARGVDTWNSEVDKHTVRQAFWAEVKGGGEGGAPGAGRA